MAYQKDISAILGLSISTVSKALKGYSDVSEETRRKVLKTAEEIDYRCRGSGPGEEDAAPVRSGAIGVLIPDCRDVLGSSRFSRRVVCGIIEAAAFKGRDAVIMDMEDENGSMSCIGKIAARKLEGVCLIANAKYLYDGRLADLFESSIPLVCVEQEAAGHISVCSDKRANAEILLRYLGKRGHRKLAYSGDLSLESRKNAAILKEVAEKLDMSCLEDKFGMCEKPESDPGAAEAVACAAEGVTCVVVRTGQNARERAAKWLKHGLRVPQSLSVAVLEAGEMDAEERFTGIDRLPEEIGREAVRRLIGIIEHPETDTGETVNLTGVISESGTVLDLSGSHMREILAM